MKDTGDEMVCSSAGRLSHKALRNLCAECGVDDVGFVNIERQRLQPQRSKILEIFPETRSLISLAVFLNRENARTPARNLTSLDVHLAEDLLAMASRAIVMKLQKYGVKGVYLTPIFPQDYSRPGAEALNISHKLVAEEAGLGLMGLNRLVLHPKVGSSVLLTSVLIDKEIDSYDEKVSEKPCIDCKLCVEACPVGAINDNGEFEWLACLIHNYRELVGSFVDWVDALVSSPDMDAYRERFTNQETVSWWQSLAYLPNYQCNHCVGVCPAGKSVREEYEGDPKSYFDKVVRPLIERPQTVYVIQGSKAEKCARSNPSKKVKTVNPQPM